MRMHGMRRRYQHEEVGWNSRMDTLQAAVLLVKLGFIDEWNAQRRALSRKLPDAFRAGGPGRAWALSAKRGGPSQDQVQGHTRLPPVRHPGSPAGPTEGLSPGEGSRIRDLLPACAPSAASVARAWDIQPAPFRRASAPPPRYWRYPSLPSSPCRNRKSSSPQSQTSSAESTATPLAALGCEMTSLLTRQ